MKSRGLAVGILTASTATGQLILLPLLAIIIDDYSWRWAIGLMLILSIVMFIAISIFMKNKPQDIGILPYGLEEDLEVQQENHKKNPVSIAFNGLFEAIRKKEFWLLAGSFFYLRTFN